jgi:methionyl-tRNA formyltransferase
VSSSIFKEILYMKIIFMGSSSFAIPSLEMLISWEHEIALVVCQPDKPAGRGLSLHPCPVALFATAKGLPLFQPRVLKDSAAVSNLKRWNPDLIIVVAYGKILPQEILDLPGRGCINVHASLLPKYRGAAPINWAIVNGETKTGVTTMLINEKMDAGDILLQESTLINTDETSDGLHDRLALIGARLLIETIKGIEDKNIVPHPQDHSQATYAPILKKEDGLINWREGAGKIINLVRGMQPWPVAYTHLEGKMLRIFHAHAAFETQTEPAGTIVSAQPSIAVATGEGNLYLDEVQLEGKKRMHVSDFLRGHHIAIGTILGTK